MISLISGDVIEIGSNYAVIDIGGLGYKVFVPADALHELSTRIESTAHKNPASHANPSKIKLWTYLAVRENALDLYGFLRRGERDFFELLISVSGIGPKTALNILSSVSSETLAGAIRTGSTAHLVKVSGIGRKTAEKIVLELKDKLGGLEASLADQTMLAGKHPVSADVSSDLDAILALEALGYDADESRDALRKITSDAAASHSQAQNTSAKVKAALRILK